MKCNFRTEHKPGLSKVYEHYIDYNGYKYYTTYNQCYGEFIRQIQDDRNTFDSSDGQPFQNRMRGLGFTLDKYDLFRVTDNRNKFEYHVYGTDKGIPNNPVLVHNKGI
jgi:hypothetical protein